MRYMLLFILKVLSEDICLPGSSECVKNVMRTCDLNGKWTYVDCPNNTECKISKGSISCSLISEKSFSKSENDDEDDNKNLGKHSSTNKKAKRRKTQDDEPIKKETKHRKGISGKLSKKRKNDKEKSNQPHKNFDDDDKSINRNKIKDSYSSKNNDTENINDEDDEVENKNSPDEEEDSNNDETVSNKKEPIKKKRIKTVTITTNIAHKHIKTVTVSLSNRDYAEKSAPVTVISTILQQTAPKEIKFEYSGPGNISKEISMNRSDSSGNNSMKSGSGGNDVSSSVPRSNLTDVSSDSTPIQSGGSTPSNQNDKGGISQTPNASETNSSSSAAGSSQNSGSLPSSGDSMGTQSAGTDNNSQSSSNNHNALSESKPSSSPPSGGSSSPSGSTSSPSGGSSSPSGAPSSPSSNLSSSPPGGPPPSSGASSSPSSSPGGSDSSSNSSGSSSSSGGSSGGSIINKNQLLAAMKSMNFQPKNEYVEAVIKKTNEKIKDKEMAAMFLAQLAHESGGFQFIEEIACAGGNKCAGQYGTGVPGKSYHGRGFIQLSWPDNYKKAGAALGMGDKLYQNPEMVAKDPNLGMDVSIWYWTTIVEKAPGVKDKKSFGATTKAINGELECKNNQNIDKSKKRYAIYKALCKEMGIKNPAAESGCYT